MLLALLTLIVDAPVVRNGFISLDDDKGIFNNLRVQQGLTRGTAWWALTTTEQASWYPLRRLSHLVDVSLFGMWAGGHHLVNAGWHASASGLLLTALWSMTGAFWRSLFVASLFALHPLQVESVAWAIERSNVQSGFFFALTLLFWTHYARRLGAARYGAVFLSLALGLMAKPSLMVLPFLLLLLDFWPLNRLTRPGSPPWRFAPAMLGRCVLEKVPLLFLAAGAGVVAVAAHQQAGALSSLEELPLPLRLANAALSYWRYLGKMFWPVDLAVHYPHPLQIPLGQSVTAGVLLAAVTGLVIIRGRAWPWLGVGWLWFLGMLAPMLGIVQFGVHAMADRFAYLAAIGVFLGLAWSAAKVVPPGNRGFMVGGLVSAVALLGCSLLTVRQIGRWRDSLTLYEHTLAVTRDNWKIEYNFARELSIKKRTDEAIEHYRRSISVFSTSDANNNLGVILLSLGRGQEAVASFQAALRIDPASVEALNNLGIILNGEKKYVEAEEHFRRAVALRPNYTSSIFNLGIVLESQGRRKDAIDMYRRVLSIAPGDVAAAAALRKLLATP